MAVNNQRATKILKFGGTSVGSKEGLERVLLICQQACAEASPPVIAVSAFSKVTDQLLGMGRLAAQGDSSYMSSLKELANRHQELAQHFIQGAVLESLQGRLNALLGDLADVLHGILLVRDISPKVMDFVASFGERLSAQIVTHILQQRGIKANFVDASSVVHTDSNFGCAQVDIKSTNHAIQALAERLAFPWVVTGFIGANSQGQVTTLGRGGSDYTASIFGAALGAAEIQIWTDVSGFMTADPKKVAKALPIAHLSFEEAMELSHFGAKVVYPPTLQPAVEYGIPLRILNSFDQSFAGTLIDNTTPNVAEDRARALTGISSISDIAVLTVQGSGMVGVAGVASRLFAALSREKISVILISQASSEHSICFAIEPNFATQAKKALEREFTLELAGSRIEPIVVERGLSIIAAVGSRMRSTPGVSGRLFQALGKNGVNIKAIAQGSSELNISVVVNRDDERKALSAVHDAFFLSDITTANVFLFGPGRVGQALLRQIESQALALKTDWKLELKLIGIADSKRSLLQPAGVETSRGRELLNERGTQLDLMQLISAIKGLNLPNSIVVDCTASEEVANIYEELLRANISIVSANKRANAAELSRYRRLHQVANASNAKFYYETNVGAGLPIINTLQDLLASGDDVQQIEAVLSGTLSYIFNALDAAPDTTPTPGLSGPSFSQLVRDAHARGYTEPDPRDDLRGTDVARKLLILSREIGLELSESDVEVESLVPALAESAASVDEFFNLLAEQDAQFARRNEEARRRQAKLRYLAQISRGKAQVRVVEVDSKHPFYDLSGSDNIVSFVTKRYSERPLVVRGPGAGTEVTAAGVFADVIRAAGYFR